MTVHENISTRQPVRELPEGHADLPGDPSEHSNESESPRETEGCPYGADERRFAENTPAKT